MRNYVVELTEETLKKVRYIQLLIEYHQSLKEGLEADMQRLVQEETGLESGEIDLDKGVVHAHRD